jgi:hypothetical protein
MSVLLRFGYLGLKLSCVTCQLALAYAMLGTVPSAATKQKLELLSGEA